VPLGVAELTVISIGTGSDRPRIVLEEPPLLRTMGIALHALTALVSDAGQLVDMQMSLLGRAPPLLIYRRLNAAEKIPMVYEFGVQAAEQQILRHHLEPAICR
jgi:hypothetical protein